MNGAPEKTVINVVSGKGGTGKTLLACVLADMLGNVPDSSAIVIDLDIFVRGLTSLLYFHRDEKLHLASSDELVVANFFIEKIFTDLAENRPLAIRRYRSFGVVPAVSTIDEILNYPDIGPDNRSEAREIVTAILSKVPDSYRFIILDSRAGYDELVAATHDLSNVSICVEEQDPISRVTADNLIAQLRSASRTPLFRLVNKVRGISSVKQLDIEVRSVTDLGLIPFDMDVMNSFGSKDFWEEISQSMYRSAVARAWNRLAGKMQLGLELRVPRISPVGSERLESLFGLFSSRDRIFLLYGLLIAMFGTMYGIFGKEILHEFSQDPVRLLSFVMGVIGLLFSLSVLFKRR